MEKQDRRRHKINSKDILLFIGFSSNSVMLFGTHHFWFAAGIPPFHSAFCAFSMHSKRS